MNPLMLISPVADIIGGAVGYKKEQKALQRQIDDAEKARLAQEKAADAARANMKGFTMGPGARDAYMRSQQDMAGDLALQEVQRAQGAGLGALEAGGARSLMFASTLARGSAMDAAKQLAAQQARRAEGQATFAEEQQRIAELETNRVNEQRSFDLGRALGLYDEARYAGDQARGMQEASQANFAQDLISAGGELLQPLALGIQARARAEEGAKIMETPGEFSHKTNPIDLVRNGKKIGEATGGELIFNPEQSGKLEQLASDGETDLHRYLRGLFKKFNTKK